MLIFAFKKKHRGLYIFYFGSVIILYYFIISLAKASNNKDQIS
jgi:hypothetical protein